MNSYAKNPKSLSDEEAIRIANGMPANSQVKNGVPAKKPRTNITECTASELFDLYADAFTRLQTYESMTPSVRGQMKDSISGTARFVLAVRLQMNKVCDQEEIQHFLNENGFVATEPNQDELNDLRHKNRILGKQIRKLQDTRTSEREKRKQRNIEFSNSRNQLIFSKFKEIVSREVGESKFLSMIKEASVSVDQAISNGASS